MGFGSALLSRLLSALRYPRLTNDWPGHHPTVGVRRVRLPGSVACQLTYPAAAPSDVTAPYWRPAAVSGMESSMRLPTDTLGHLRRRKHPCAADAIPKRGAFPIVVFSPGLYGSSEVYSQLCASISSFGYIVAALEHEDGSACYADAGDGAIPYKRPPAGFAYGRDSVVGFRRPFLDQRLRETESAILALLDKNADGALGEVLAATQERSSVVLTGHSFGGASAVRVSQELGRTRPGAISKLALLDTWAFSLDDATVNRGTSLPTLSIICDAWTTNLELPQLRTLCARSSPSWKSYFAPATVHQSVSDSSTWTPSFVGRRMGSRGADERELHRTRFATAQAVDEFIRGAPLAEGALQPFELAGSADAV